MSNSTPQVVNNGDPEVNKETPVWFLKYSWFAKAIMASVSAFLLGFLSGLVPYIGNDWHISLLGWVTALISGIVAAGGTGAAVYVTPNTVKVK